MGPASKLAALAVSALITPAGGYHHRLPQRRPDRDTRGYFDRRGRRVWLDVFQ